MDFDGGDAYRPQVLPLQIDEGSHAEERAFAVQRSPFAVGGKDEIALARRVAVAPPPGRGSMFLQDENGAVIGRNVSVAVGPVIQGAAA